MSPYFIRIRRADPQDRERLIAMQTVSLRTLGRGYYTPEVIEAFIDLGTMDQSLIDDRRFFAIEVAGDIVACGGWSLRTPNYESLGARGHAHLPHRPLVRAVYVHPDHARQGLGRIVMQIVENDMIAAGHREAALTATLS